MFQFGEVTTYDSSTNELRIKFTGESNPSGIKFKRLESYTPAVGDKVFVEREKKIVLGKVI